jgi:hypothetical protein
MMLRRRPVHDVFTADGETAVLTDTEVVLLSPLAASLFVLLDSHWIPHAALGPDLVAEYGEPDRSAGFTSVDAAVEVLADQLVRQGLVERADDASD